MNCLLVFLSLFALLTIPTDAQWGYYGSPFYNYGGGGLGYGYRPNWVTGAIDGAIIGGLVGAVVGKKK
ncbi:unnamed protein product [Angiostrongylus costaricensis]|uniref:Rick_17kDa_Anti domain-containing protein n=1 Tax=Angiostrongylus costaricensis TaxID=334426 RepID=A0A0R3PYR4_ANGCS|nr:unnamed protein product [Angiostrongylus costaricensis]